MERTEARIDRGLVERAREAARKEGRGKSELIEDALRRYLDHNGGRVSISETLDRARRTLEVLTPRQFWELLERESGDES